MKSFLLAVGVFCAVSVFIALFTLHDVHAAERLIESATAVSAGDPADTEALNAFRSLWEKERQILSFSINHMDLERVDTALSALLGAAEAGEPALFRQAAVVLVRATEHLYHGIVPAWEHII